MKVEGEEGSEKERGKKKKNFSLSHFEEERFAPLSLLHPKMPPLIAAGCATRPACSVAGRKGSRALANDASSVKSRRSSPTISTTSPRPSSLSSTAVRATKTIASKPSSPSSKALEKVGTQLLSFAKDKKNKGGSGADTIIVPAGAESQLARRLIFSLLRAGKNVVAGALFLFLFVRVEREHRNARDDRGRG